MWQLTISGPPEEIRDKFFSETAEHQSSDVAANVVRDKNAIS